MKSEIAIIGAGVAGVNAAVHLAKAGYEVSLFESKNFPGGRVFSYMDKLTGEFIDNGQHILAGAYVEFLGLLDELGSSIHLNKSDSLMVNFADAKGNKFILDTGKFPGNLGILYGFMKFGALSIDSKILLFNLIVKLKWANPDFGNINCLDFLKKQKQNQQLIDIFWTPLILAVLNDLPESVSARLLIEVLQRAFFAGGKASGLILPKVELSKLLKPFDKWISNKSGRIHYQSNISKLIIENGVAVGLILKDGTQFRADYIISTVQPNALINILPDEQNLIKEFSYSSIINIYYWLNRHVDTPDFAALVGTTSQWMFNRRNFIKTNPSILSKYPGLINITISGANRLNEYKSEELIELCFEELKSAFPKFSSCNILHSKIIRDKRATITATPIAEMNRPDAQTDIPRLFLAGDWTNTGLPATIEGAALSGRKAAELIIK